MPAPITTEDWARLSTLFDSARDLPPAEQQPWLDRLGREQPDLAPWLRDMLAAHAARNTGDWLERGPTLPAGRVGGADANGPAAGARVGPWLLQEPLGSGGMATVWRAVRADALPAREVALKLPLAHRAGSMLAERFAREQDILARLEHPHIARLYDAGVADDGTPWLAMECVRGERIDRWCDRHRLGIRDRLVLFAQVLGAVQYAHARLVIHRDLKPSNILVTGEGSGEGQVRLLDFGIARLLANDGEHADPALTQAAHRVMTPAYAAPEQVRGEALTTAADLYALGVVLFELLVGRSPYRLQLDSAAQLELAVANADVQHASAAVQDDAAAVRGGSPRALRRALAGDLDTVLAKALAADPADRYASAAAFADDLARHLGGRPVAAQRGSAGYRLRKWVGRHRLQALAGAAVALAVVGGTSVAWWQAGIARHERDAALAEAERSSAINFFYSDLLEDAAHSSEPINGDQLVARAEALARSEFTNRPDELAAVFVAIGMLRNSQGRAAEGRRFFEEAYAKVRDPAFRNDVACDLATLLDDHARATAMLSEVAAASGTSARSRAACLVYLGDLLRDADPAEAQRRYQQAMQQWEQSRSRSPHDRITILGRLAFVAALQGRGGEAERGFEQALRLADAMGRDGSAMGNALRNRLGRALLIGGAPERALPLFEQVLADHARQQPGTTAPADVQINQGQALLDLGRAADAVVVLRSAAQSAAAASHPARRLQADCLGAWAALLAGNAASAAAVPADAAAAGDDALSRTACAIAHGQRLRAQQQWPALEAQLSALLAQHLPEPQWAIEARLLRAEGRLAADRRDDAAADARLALTEARRLQDGSADSMRARAAEALLARSRR